jgi:lysophospholipid acyltransferase (LPLAT)-like uncharacterized protein
MKLRHPLLLKWAGFFAACLLRVWGSTIRHLRMSVDGTYHPRNPDQQRCVYAVWHESVTALAFIHTKIDLLISHHADGEFGAQACRFLNVGVIRGSSTRGGATALLEMIQRAQSRHILVTPDGPRGPRHMIRPGLVFLASVTGLPIVLIGIGYSRAWRLKTWDRMAIPFPWSTTCGVISEPIYIPQNIRTDDFADYCSQIEQRFIKLTASAERWAETGRRPSRAELQDIPSPALAQKCA